MEREPLRIAVSGAAGQIAYQLLFHLAAGDPFGLDRQVRLHLLEVPEALPALKGVEMELQDGAFPLLDGVYVGSDPYEIFGGVDIALLVGAKPRTVGMERGDLLQENAKIFVEQGKALDRVASEEARVIVVGNPCNTNAWIAMHMASRLPKTHFFAMTTLDENRAKAQLAKKANIAVKEVKNITIWGNHSTTQVPDFVNGTIRGVAIEQVISDTGWLQGEFQQIVQQRGAKVIQARGKSSAASAARGIVDLLRFLYTPTPEGQWFSVALCSDGNPYGIAEDLLFSFPCQSNGRGDVVIAPHLRWTPFLKEKILASEKELREEKQCIATMVL